MAKKKSWNHITSSSFVQMWTSMNMEMYFIWTRHKMSPISLRSLMLISKHLKLFKIQVSHRESFPHRQTDVKPSVSCQTLYTHTSFCTFKVKRWSQEKQVKSMFASVCVWGGGSARLPSRRSPGWSRGGASESLRAGGLRRPAVPQSEPAPSPNPWTLTEWCFWDRGQSRESDTQTLKWWSCNTSHLIWTPKSVRVAADITKDKGWKQAHNQLFPIFLRYQR